MVLKPYKSVVQFVNKSDKQSPRSFEDRAHPGFQQFLQSHDSSKKKQPPARQGLAFPQRPKQNQFRFASTSTSRNNHVMKTQMPFHPSSQNEAEEDEKAYAVRSSTTVHENKTEIIAASSPSKLKNTQDRASPPSIDTFSHHHLEIKACLLAHKHIIDCGQISNARQRQRQELLAKSKDQSRAEEQITLMLQHKIQYLLDHFLTLDHPHEKQLVEEIVSDWCLQSSSSAGKVNQVWDSINDQIEQSFILSKHMSPTQLPDELAIVIALDCLQKLTFHFPGYARLLDVVHEICVRSIFLPTSESRKEDQTTDETTHHRMPYYALVKEKDEALDKIQTKTDAWKDFEIQSNVEKAVCMFDAIESLTEQRTLLLHICANIRTCLLKDRPNLNTVEACEWITTILNRILPPDFHDDVKMSLIQSLPALVIEKILHEIHETHRSVFLSFCEGHVDEFSHYFFSSSSSKVGEQLLEKNIASISRILFNAPYLLSHMIQIIPNLMERILGQNAFAVSSILASNQGLFKLIFGQLVKDNFGILEDHFSRHPRLFQDLLVHCPENVTRSIRAAPDVILSQIFHSCDDLILKLYLDEPEILARQCLGAPDLLMHVFNRNEGILAQALKQCPRALSLVLQDSPTVMVDIVHRVPQLVVTMFQHCPDLLIEPLERNPSILSQFVSEHPEVLTDPILESMGYYRKENAMAPSIETQDVSTQTASSLGSSGSSVNISSTAGGSSKSKKKVASALNRVASIKMMTSTSKKRISASQAWTLDQLETFVPKMYQMKLDRMQEEGGCTLSFPDMIQDHLLERYHLKSSATKQYVGLTLGIHKFESTCPRIQMFGILLGIVPFSSGTSTSSRLEYSYHPATISVYLKALQLLIPNRSEIEATLLASSAPKVVSSSVILEDESEAKNSDRGQEAAVTTKDEDTTVSTSPQYCLSDHHIVHLEEHMYDHGQTAEVLFPSCLSEELTPRLRLIHSSNDTEDDSNNSNTLSVGIDHVLSIVIEVWLKYQQAHEQELFELFSGLNANSDGVITYQDFSTMMLRQEEEIKPEIKPRRMMQLFRQICGDENKDGEYEMKWVRVSKVQCIHCTWFKNNTPD